MDGVEIDPSFEPLQRVRANTWPQPRPENYVDKDDVTGGGGLLSDGSKGHDGLGSLVAGAGGVGPLPKKNSSRRNAWGNMSYADLITQAIQSSPDKRLTLSQIYDWMVQNVPYFKDKGDSNSSAGWKNSIRHNLSLHNRFMRVQNEGTGKSSWWMINPDAKPGKAARRRATSMETQKYEKRRGRIKKKVEALRNGILSQQQQLLHQSADATPSPCSSSLSESLDMFSDSPPEMIGSGNGNGGFQLSPDFRPRASSNASSCGRLSPIPALPDTDLNDSQVPPLSPIPWASEPLTLNQLHPVQMDGNGMVTSLFNTDQLVETLTETMKLGGPNISRNNEVNGVTNQRQLSPLHVQGVTGRAQLLSLLPSANSLHSSNSFVSLQQHYTNGISQSPQSLGGTSGGSATGNGGTAGGTVNGGNGGGTGVNRFQEFSPPANVYQGGHNDLAKLSPQHLMVDQNNGTTSYTNMTSLQAALSPTHSIHSISPPVDSLPNNVDQSVVRCGTSTPPQQQPQQQPSLQRSLESVTVLSPHSNSAYSCTSASSPIVSNVSVSGRGYRALTMNSSRVAVNTPNGVGANCNGVGRPDNNHINAGGLTAHGSALLRAALTPKGILLNSVQNQAQGMSSEDANRESLENFLIGQTNRMDCGEQDDDCGLSSHLSTTSVSQMMGQLLSMPNDLELSLDTLQGGLECDVDQVINHELSVDGNLDFNFADPHSAAAAMATANGRHWVVH
ncbi:hypothetical protein CHUAL_011426 [Chamberlinius hualienensis]